MRILVVEDDLALSEILARILREESYAVDIARDGQEGEWMAYENPYDLIILDLMLPVQDGMTVLEKLRANKQDTPVMILTAKDTKQDVVSGLNFGADDYVTKPFDVEELVARVRVLLRRGSETQIATLEAGGISLDPSKKQAMCNSQLIDLTTKEYALLEYLLRKKDTVISRVEISEHVWDLNFEPSSNVVDVYIGYLRNKIDKVFGTQYIKTVRGHGYMLDSIHGDANNILTKPVEAAASL